MALQVRLLSQLAKAPTRGSAFAAGWDLYSVEDITIPKRGRGVVKTGISVAIPDGYYGRVAPRSGLAVKHGIDCGAGVIDCDYRGELMVQIFNHSDEDYNFTVGERVSQLIIEKISMEPLQVVDVLPESVRGEGRFGSSGTH